VFLEFLFDSQHTHEPSPYFEPINNHRCTFPQNDKRQFFAQFQNICRQGTILCSLKNPAKKATAEASTDTKAFWFLGNRK
jgi:hypothetical protein